MIQKEFDWNVFDAICQFHPTLKTSSQIMGVSEDTIERRIKDKTGQTFKEYRDEKEGSVKLSLQQKALQMALAGDKVMLIFSLKNLCGWSDNNGVDKKGGDQDTGKTVTFNLNYSIPPKEPRTVEVES